jgi:hypothetical protein
VHRHSALGLETSQTRLHPTRWVTELALARLLHELIDEARLEVGSRASSARLASHILVNIIALYIINNNLYYSIKRAKSASTPCGAPACPSHARTHSVPLPPPLEAHDFSAIVPPSSHCMPRCDHRPLPTAPTFVPRPSSTIHRWSFHRRHPTSIVGVHDMPPPPLPATTTSLACPASAPATQQHHRRDARPCPLPTHLLAPTPCRVRGTRSDDFGWGGRRSARLHVHWRRHPCADTHVLVRVGVQLARCKEMKVEEEVHLVF